MDRESQVHAVHRRIVEDDVRLVRFLYCDPAGVIRGKTAHASQTPGKLREGVGLTRAQNAVNLLEDLIPVEGMEPVGEVRLIPDLSTFVVHPWLDRTASVICDQREQDGSAWGGCTRTVLTRAIERAAAAGIRVFAAFETEFYLAELDADGHPRPWQNGPVYSSSGMDRAARVTNRIVDHCTEQGLIVEQCINEYGPGQQEIAIRYDEAMRAADNHIRLRDTIRGTTEVEFGLLASLAPKPFPDGIGSGNHLHFSLWNADATMNLLYNPDEPTRLSDFGKSFVAGVLEHLPALIGLTCPSFVSFHRLQPHAWAGSTVSWGYDNRECAVRVASPFLGREMESINLELKASDSTANPYMALAGVILAGLDGVARGLVPPEPAPRDPVLLTVAQQAACGIRPLPASQAEALDALERDALLMEGLGDLLGRAYLATRRAENAKCLERGDEWARLATFSTF